MVCAGQRGIGGGRRLMQWHVRSSPVAGVMSDLMGRCAARHPRCGARRCRISRATAAPCVATGRVLRRIEFNVPPLPMKRRTSRCLVLPAAPLYVLRAAPLVTSYSAPVTMAAASEPKNTAAGEISSGCSQPTLSGTVGDRTSHACCGVGLLGGFWPVPALLSVRRFR